MSEQNITIKVNGALDVVPVTKSGQHLPHSLGSRTIACVLEREVRRPTRLDLVPPAFAKLDKSHPHDPEHPQESAGIREGDKLGELSCGEIDQHVSEHLVSAFPWYVAQHQELFLREGEEMTGKVGDHRIGGDGRK